MQRKVAKKEISKKLNFLHVKLPTQPTAIKGCYRLPKNLKRDIIKSKFSQSSIQALADNIGYFLGRINKVKVTIGIESSEYMLAAAGDYNKYGQIGLYKVFGGCSPEIQLTKKFRFELKHILAILIHESVHNYLYHHGITESSKSENELLTDIAAAYLGLGHLLLAGYKPITWTGDYEINLFGSSHKQYTTWIGYVTPRTIRSAIVESTKLRCWELKEALYGLSILDRIIAYFQLLPYRIQARQLQKEKKRTSRFAKKQFIKLESLSAQADEVWTAYNRVCNLMQHTPNNLNQPSVSTDDGYRLVEIANEIASGKTQFEIKNIIDRIQKSKSLSTIESGDIKYLSNQLNKLMPNISGWQKLLNKYA